MNDRHAGRDRERRRDTGVPAAGLVGIGVDAVVRALLFCLVTIAACMLYGWHLPDTRVSLQMRSTTGVQGEIFFAGPGEGYSARKRVPFALAPDVGWHAYVVELPAVPTDRIRLDPGTRRGAVEIRSVVVRSGRHVEVFTASRLANALGITHQIGGLHLLGAGLAFAATGRDPYLEVRLPRTLGVDRPGRLLRLAAVAAAAFAAWLGLECLKAPLVRLRRRAILPTAVTSRFAAAISDDALLRVDQRMLLVAAALVAASVLYVGARFNQSSIGIWGTVYPATPIQALDDLGNPKRIRSDEWKVLTPWVFNQALRGNPSHNLNVGGADAPLLASVPVDGAIGVPQVKFAGFGLFGLDRGFSWWWAYKSFGLLFSLFWLCLLLTRGDVAASALGAAWIYASSFTQWWFSSDLPEILIAFALGTVGALYALFSTRRRLIVLGCALIAYAAANLLQNLYPPFIVSLGYLAVAIVAGHALRIAAISEVRRSLGFRVGALGLTLLAIAAYTGVFASAAAASIEAMRETVYPGHRIAASGGVSQAKLLYGVFEAFRIDERQWPLPALSSNACEASTFVLLFPLALVVLPWRAWSRRQSALLLALVAFSLLGLLWIAVRLPTPLELPLQLLGWSLVTPKRAVLALGIGSILACTVAFAAVRDGDTSMPPRALRGLVLAGLAFGVVLFGMLLRRADAEFFSWTVLALGGVACVLGGAGILFGSTRLLVAGLALFALPTLSVNPLARGIAPLADKPLLLAAERQSDRSHDTWAVIGDNFLAQGLKAHGLTVFGGAAYLPDRAAMRVLDPDGRYAQVWNRYATIQLTSTPGTIAPVFRQTRGDQYAIRLDVCAGPLRALGVTRLAYTQPVPAGDLRCLDPLPAPDDSGVRLFRLK